MCANGAKSPEAPTDPCAGTTGTKPLASISSSMAVVAGLVFPMVGLSMLMFAAVELAGLGLRRARHA